MRWSAQQVDELEARELPGYRDPAVIRTFDAPEALDTRFYEVRAKSALNRVPERSQMPFRWTINPYRGCTHACRWCVSADTQILMADGSARPICDIRAGDQIYGTVGSGRRRRYRKTEVLQHWAVERPGGLVSLADGTELIAGANHRFLTESGWKYVCAQGGRGQRPHLAAGDELCGPGRFVEGPVQSSDYRRGYVCAMVGAGGPFSAMRKRDLVRAHRVAEGGSEAIERGRRFLHAEGFMKAYPRVVEVAGGALPEMHATGALDPAGTAELDFLSRWPLSPSDDWRKGFLAGAFDAEGSCSEWSLRISSRDPLVAGWTEACLESLGFGAIAERPRADGCRDIRFCDGAPERLRFFQQCDPATSHKRDIEGMALVSDTELRVAAVRPLSAVVPMYDITTGTGDFISGGVVSHNCFARPTHIYLDFNAGRDFEKEIVVKVNVPEVLRAELSRPRWKREHVALGTNTDPYQWVEGRYRLMPGIWEALRDSGTPGSVLTKSPLLLRDIDLMKRVPGISAALSVPTLEEKAWRATEPHTPHPRARLEAVAELNRAGIPTSVLVAPLQPGINDSPEQVERILELAAEAGAVSVSGIALHLRGEVKGVFFDWLRSQRPDLLPLYERLYARGAYMPRDEARKLAALVRRPGQTTDRFWREEPPIPIGPPPAKQERLF